MEKLKFNTVGQFLVALEKGPLYCNEENSKLTFDDSEVIVEDLKIRTRSSYRVMRSLVKLTEKVFTRQKPIPDKALVWCWDNADIACRAVRFYSAEDGCVFHLYGHRNGSSYDHYEVIEPNEQGIYEEPFAWANEAVKKLED